MSYLLISERTGSTMQPDFKGAEVYTDLLNEARLNSTSVEISFHLPIALGATAIASYHKRLF